MGSGDDPQWGFSLERHMREADVVSALLLAFLVRNDCFQRFEHELKPNLVVSADCEPTSASGAF
jgi:hypothetical protein